MSPSPSPTPRTNLLPTTNATPLHLSLADAVYTGLATSPDMRQARANVEQASLQVDAVGVQMNPTLSVGATYYHQFQPIVQGLSPLAQFLDALIPNLIRPIGTSQDFVTGTATLQKLVTTFGRVQWETTAARLSVEQARQDYLFSLNANIQEIQVAYISALLAEGQLGVAQQVLEDQQSLLQISQDRANAGLIPEYDVIQFQSTVASSQQQVEYAQSIVEAQRVALLAQIGLPVTEAVTLDPLPDPIPPPKSLAEGMDRALRLRPDLAALQWSVQAAEAQVEAAARTSYPSVTVLSTYNGTANFGQNWQPDFIAGLQVQVPVMDGGEARVLTDQAKVAVEQARASLETVRREVGQDVASAYVTLASTWLQLQQAQVALTTSQQALDIARLRFQAGLSDANEVLNVQNLFIEAAGNLETLKAAYWTAEANWRYAIADEGDVAIPEELRMEANLPPMPPPDPTRELPDRGYVKGRR